jgi:3-deoxy-D-manno-octulosonate 8-phosphate phosphatase KdsC-like HAD superfamily phosphatase
MAGIGDARPDIPFLEKVGLPFAPGNAHDDVKAVCSMVSEHADSEAAIELLDYVIAHNRGLPLVPESMTAGDAIEHS